jgi:hypothetical protein
MNEFNGYSEHFAIGQAMVTYGGSFHKNLGKALQMADKNNQEKIKNAWPEDWGRFRVMAIKMYSRERQNEY